jgi:tetratricopeptide (TPR) repeat protein
MDHEKHGLISGRDRGHRRMFEAAEPFDVEFLEYFLKLAKKYLRALPPSRNKPNLEKVELAKIKVEQVMREVVDGQDEFADTFLDAALKDDPATVVWGLAMTVWASAGPMAHENLRQQAQAVLSAAMRKQPAHRLLVFAHAVIARNTRRYSAAHKYYDMMLRLDGSDVEAVDEKIQVFMAQEDYQRARQMLVKARGRWPDDERLIETEGQFKRDSKSCPDCGTWMRFAAPYCPKCNYSFL